MGEEKQNMAAGTLYDDVYRTLIVDCPSLIIPVVNEVFHQKLQRDTSVTALENEIFLHQEDGKIVKRITDSNLFIHSKYYHFECQSTVDNTMLIRFFEYDSQIALKNSKLSDNKLVVKFPEAAVLYLRHNSRTPDKMIIVIEVPEDECSYSIPVMKTSTYTIDEIFEKQLYFLIPFHIFAYESNFEEYDTNREKLEELQHIYEEIMERLEVCAESGLITEYIKKTIITMSKQVLEKISQKYEKIRKGVGEIMGGKVLEYEAKDILRQGIAEGHASGLIEGDKNRLLILIQKKLAKGKDTAQIAEELEETEDVILKLMEEIKQKERR